MSEKITSKMELDRPDRVRFSEVHEKAKKILPHQGGQRIDPSEFKDLYGEQVVYQDEQYVWETKEVFRRKEGTSSRKKEAKDVSDAFETLISDQVDLSNWFGENASVIRASEYDDYKNKVDAIIEFILEGSTSHLALGIDITYSRESLSGKIHTIRKMIEEGILAQVKYFISDIGGFRGELKNIPIVVVGADMEILDELFDTWIRFQRLRKQKNKEGQESVTKKIRELNLQLQNHKVQVQLLRQIKMQLEKFHDFAQKSNQTKIADKLRANLSIINSILETKPPEIMESRSNFEEALEQELDNIFGL